jgi:PAS domain S-box-containing protein
MSCPIPANESERLAALRGLGVLDAPSVPGFDAICQLARDHFDTPIALLTLIDSDTQILKGRCGLDLSSTPRNVAFCSHAIMHDELLIVPDATRDPRFCDNPLVIGEPHIRFYAGVPLVLKPGIRVGSLCIIDRKPRQLGDEERAALRRFAELATESLRHHETAARAAAQEDELGRQQVVLSHAQELAPVGLWDWDLVTNNTQWSDATYRILGWEPEKVDASFPTFLSVVHPDDRADVEHGCRILLEQGVPVQQRFRIVRPDGQVRTVVSRGEVLKDAAGKSIRAVGLTHDVTELERAETALRASEARWRHALAAGRMIGFEIDVETGWTTFSEHGGDVIGRSQGHYEEFIAEAHADDRAMLHAVVQNALRAGNSCQVEFRFSRPNGDWMWLSMSGGLISDGSPPSRRLAGVCFDITERKKLEASLQESEARFRDFAEISSDWLWETDDQFRLCRVVGDPPEVLGVALQDVIGKTRWEICNADPESAAWKPHLDAHHALRPYREFESQRREPNGEVRYLVSSGRPFFDRNGKFLGYRGTSADRTERKKLEAQLQQALRMDALGQLTGGVAHDFNNLLTIILGNAESLADALWAEAELQPLAEMVLGAATRGADLTRRLLAFARRQALEPKVVSVNAVVESMVDMLRRSLGEQIALRTELSGSVANAFVDTGLLETSILNLAVNAKDAMPRGGTLIIRTAAVSVPEQTVDLARGEYVELSVADSGQGIPAEVMRHVFEPFFTTKPVGRGCGLGLSMAYGFAKQSGGHIGLDSTPGKGTTVRLLLPVAAASEASRPADTTRTVTSGTERILVVEDEPDVRHYVVQQLTRLGYSIAEAASGPAALIELREHGPFDLLFTDVVLPDGMSGLDLADAARTIQPDLRVLLTSGYSEEMALGDGRGDLPLLKKPYARHELASMLRAALEPASIAA